MGVKGLLDDGLFERGEGVGRWGGGGGGVGVWDGGRARDGRGESWKERWRKGMTEKREERRKSGDVSSDDSRRQAKERARHVEIDEGGSERSRRNSP